MPRLALIFSAALMVCAALAPARAAAEPPQFGVEVGGGTAAGLTSYLRNEVALEEDRTRTDEQGRPLLQPFLADRQTGTGTSVAVRLIASNIAAGVSLTWFDLPQNNLHHAGASALSRSRIRPDGSIDDSGIDYAELDPVIEQPISEDMRRTLFVMGLDAEYRFMWPGDNIDIFVPAGAGLVITHVNRDAGPYRLGLDISSGVGVTINLSESIGLVLEGKLHGLATSHYGRRADAARRAVEIDETTEEAFFSTLVYASGNAALQFTIR